MGEGLEGLVVHLGWLSVTGKEGKESKIKRPGRGGGESWTAKNWGSFLAKWLKRVRRRM